MTRESPFIACTPVREGKRSRSGPGSEPRMCHAAGIDPIPDSASRAAVPRIGSGAAKIWASGAWTLLGASGAGIGAAGERLVHDALDGPRATPALRTAAQAAVDFCGRARQVRTGERGPHLIVAQHVAGTNDHRECSWRDGHD